MRPDSKELAHQIDVMVAFQNKEDIQFRERRLPSALEATWATSCSNLAFRWDKYEYRKKPVEPREGYVFAETLHQHPTKHKWKKGDGTCFLVREVLSDE